MPATAKPYFPAEVRPRPKGDFSPHCDQQFGRALRAFRERYSISLRDLSCICTPTAGGPAKSTIHNMLLDRASPGVIQKFTPWMLKGISAFLRSEGLNHQEVLGELKQLFPKENLEQMSAPRTELDYEHIEYFGLNADPFTDDPSSAGDVYTNPALNKILQTLEDAVNFQKFVAVIGDIGSGKTIMKQRLMVAAAKNRKMKLLWIKFAKMGRIKSADIVVGVLEALHQKPRARLTLAQVQLEEYLGELHQQNIRVALGFDEAHRLDPSTFSELKNLRELGTGGFDKYLGIVLFGQPQLRDRLDDLRFREITERVRVIPMPSLSKEAVKYATHRLKLAGGDLDRLIEPGAIRVIAEMVSTPQAIGNLINAALIKTYDMGEKRVLTAMVKSEFGPQVRAQRPRA